MKLAGPLAAAAVILGANAIALLGVARNRAGEPVESIQLSDRELSLNTRSEENTGVSLRLDWNRYRPRTGRTFAWLDRTKLESLGFDCTAVLREPNRRPLLRPAFIVLEYNGPAWQQLELTAEEQRLASRLVAIDAGLSPAGLLAKYSDRAKYLIMRGLIRVYATNWDPVTQKAGPYRLEASVSELLPENIHVPLPFSRSLAAPYTVTLAYGRRFEPWIVNVSR